MLMQQRTVSYKVITDFITNEVTKDGLWGNQWLCNKG